MRKGKLAAQLRQRNKVKQHTPIEKLAMRRFKRKQGPSAMRRKARRARLQPKEATPELAATGKDE